MNKKALGVFVSLLVVAMLALPMSVAYATKPTEVTWTSVITSMSMDGRFVGPNYILTFEITDLWSGYITGSSTTVGRWIWHDYPFGRINAYIIKTVSATVDGKTGVLVFMLVGNLPPYPTPGAEYRWIIIGGTEDLANLHGQGTMVVPSIPGGLYTWTGQVHFDP